ncbi:hypothetical protein [uncultured Aquimarina sp.]|uniref:hypothetical protein n=1 Tax=uncultured Aquimarina sp. TaxID=575652 RepID=UPI002603F0F5|nr:hypothetical protein [uncultured Aquimarina sp.]
MYSQIKKRQLDHPFDIIKSMKGNAKLINISEKRMHEILQAQFSGKVISITPLESKELKKLQDLMMKDYLTYNQKTGKLPIEKKASQSRYNEFKERYHSDPIFQQSVNKYYLN